MNNLDWKNAHAGRFPEPREASRAEEKIEKEKDDMLANLRIMSAHIDRHWDSIYRIEYEKVKEAINNLNEALGGVLE